MLRMLRNIDMAARKAVQEGGRRILFRAPVNYNSFGAFLLALTNTPREYLSMRIASRLLALLIVGWLAHSAAALELRSPDGNLTLTVELTPIGQPCYRLSYRHQPILAPSRLGLELQDGKRLAEGFAIGQTTTASHDTTWKPVYGERSEVRDRYNQLVVSLQSKRDPSCKLELTFRAYNEGVAFCYTIPEQSTGNEIQIAKEQSEFRFLSDHQAWAVSTAQASTSRPAQRDQAGLRTADDRSGRSRRPTWPWAKPDWWTMPDEGPRWPAFRMPWLAI